MDLNASPDLESYSCYLIVFLLGLITAIIQINRRLQNFPGRWVTWQTWMLLTAYTFLPVGLFWFLDRVNAVHDTSLFAALVIGAGYQQVLSGNLAMVKAGEVSRIWQPFTAWSDYIAERIRDRISDNSEKFDEQLRSLVLHDEKKQETMQFVAITHEKDPVGLQQKLENIEAQSALLGSDGVRLKKIAALYDSLRISSPRNFEFLLYKNGVTSRFTYLWYAREWRSKITALAILAAFILLLLGGVSYLQRPSVKGTYYVWRLKKENTTDYDRFRARRNLMQLLPKYPSPLQDLIAALRYGSLTAKTSDSIFETVIESRNVPNVPSELADSLRTSSVTTRTRIVETLLFLAEERGLSVPEDLKNWKPNTKDTLPEIERRIVQWKSLGWSAPPNTHLE